MPKIVKEELKNIAVPSDVMKQIGVDICCLPSADEFDYLIVCIDYFSKWSEAKPIHDKSPPTVAQFLYEFICWHGCFAIQINEQGREFVNEVADELHSMTGTLQRMTPAYRPQSNGLVERQNRTIKNALVKILNQNPEQWPYVINGVLFAHRVSRHASTNYSPFYLMYNREPVLPVDLKYGLNSEAAISFSYDGSFSQDMLEAVFASANTIRVDIHETLGET